ncbi:methionine--tRNA ligase [Deinococcus yavapaiensis]|uniref:Methionine--tRNA ligase n=1 Tax=Deinococcus yavapaiensis KR-236 TaxID=694435 RepID=A0A318S9Y2_9DEIO|nr:methionine--tRNA ligase [Deinococcus yavapaiensis]PYE54860.1 methionyl-tRNA synthetase [Deinococcus yavapaiensis KR-236]
MAEDNTQPSRTFYLTTAIDYANGEPHIGHTYEKILSDALVRYHRLAGYETFFLTGTDEHGEKIAKAARSAGKTPQEFVDDLSLRAFKGLYDRLGISYDDFIRTTEPRHKAFVAEVLQRVYDAGDIYYAEYEGLYSVGAERFVTEKELVNGVLPGDKEAPELRREANYFFRMEKYQDWLREHILANPDFIQPTPYRNEVLEILKEPIGDLSISRPKARVPWGIELPWDPAHVTYVWFDALLNYVSALQTGDLSERFWPHAWHVIGKDILKPHAVFWPTMLKAANLPIYKKLVVHAHILAEDGRKMGKSLGNAIDPVKLVDDFGPDVVRYSLLRETTLGSDSPYGENILKARLESDLANDLGNLLSRTLSMVEKYRGGVVPEATETTAREEGIKARTASIAGEVLDLVRELRVSQALELSMEYVRDLNRYIAESRPWDLAKRSELAARLDTVLYTAVEGLRVASVLLEPAIPTKAHDLREQLGLEGAYLLDGRWGLTPPGTRVKLGAVLFPKPDAPKAHGDAKKGAVTNETKTAPAPHTEVKPEVKAEPQGTPEITIDDFAKLDLRIAEVIAAEAVEKADKLLKLTVRLGDEERTVVSGIRKWFTPEDMVGRKVVLVANLKPAKLRGIMSQGMILAAEDEHGNLDLVGTTLDLPSGTKVR